MDHQEWEDSVDEVENDVGGMILTFAWATFAGSAAGPTGAALAPQMPPVLPAAALLAPPLLLTDVRQTFQTETVADERRRVHGLRRTAPRSPVPRHHPILSFELNRYDCVYLCCSSHFTKLSCLCSSCQWCGWCQWWVTALDCALTLRSHVT